MPCSAGQCHHCWAMSICAALLKFHELAVNSDKIVRTCEGNTCAGLPCAPCHACSALPTPSGTTPVGWQERQLPMHRLNSGKHQPQFSLRIGSCLSCLTHLCLQGNLSRLASGHSQSTKGNLSRLKVLLLCKVFTILSSGPVCIQPRVRQGTHLASS